MEACPTPARQNGAPLAEAGRRLLNGRASLAAAQLAPLSAQPPTGNSSEYVSPAMNALPLPSAASRMLKRVAKKTAALAVQVGECGATAGGCVGANPRPDTSTAASQGCLPVC